MDGTLLTVKDLATHLQVSERTVHRLVRRGMPVKWVGESLRFIYADVVAWLPEAKPRPVEQKVRPLRKGVTYMVDHLKREVETWPRS